MRKDVFQQMADKWKSPVVARTAVKEFSGGTLDPKSMANHDSLGTGPEGRFTVGRKVVYPAVSLAAWMRARASK